MREDISFYSDGVALRGWFDRPAGTHVIPVVIATHGLASTIDFVEPLATELVRAGFGVLAFDHRNLGRSDGQPRQEVDPWRQVQDMRNAISFLVARADVDPTRIGVWGASMGGGVAVTTAAFDLRVSAVVGVSLVASGWNASHLMTPPDEQQALQSALDDDRGRRLVGRPPATVPLLPPNMSDGELSASTDESIRFLYPRAKASPTFASYMTLRSLEFIRDFEPLAHAHRIGNRAILLIVASDDKLAPVADAEKLIASIPGDQTSMLVIDGHHYAPLDGRFGDMAEATVKFFSENLTA